MSVKFWFDSGVNSTQYGGFSDEKIIQKRQVLNWNSNKSISYLVWFQGLVDTESSIKVHGSVLTPGRKNKFEWKLGKVDCAIKKLHTSMSKTRQDSDSWGQLIIYCQQNTENSIKGLSGIYVRSPVFWAVDVRFTRCALNLVWECFLHQNFAQNLILKEFLTSWPPLNHQNLKKPIFLLFSVKHIIDSHPKSLFDSLQIFFPSSHILWVVLTWIWNV